MINKDARAGCSNIAVCVATFRRSHELAALLDSLCRAHARHPFRVIVVDNDPRASAIQALSDASGRWPQLQIEALHEPTPGIAAARNRALDALSIADEFAVFVDDDETLEENWMAELVATQNRFNADITTGPVHSHYPPGAPGWIVRGQYHQRTRRPTGLYPRYISKTNNVMVRLALLNRLDRPRLDNAFGLSGGSDTELFFRLRTLRPVVAWCEEAVAHEEVPRERLTFAWIRRRWVRNGNVVGRIWVQQHRRMFAVLIGTGLMTCCFIIGVLTLPWRGPRHARAVKEFLRGFGVLTAVLNAKVMEYVRS